MSLTSKKKKITLQHSTKLKFSIGANISNLRTDFMIFTNNSVIAFQKYGNTKQKYAHDQTREKRPILILFYFLKKESTITKFI